MDIMLLLAMSAIIIVPIWLIYKLIKGVSLEKLLKMIIAVVVGVLVVYFVFILISLRGPRLSFADFRAFSP